MHPKEFQKTKNTTGYFTHRSLPNSLLFKGIDFSNHKQINSIIEDENNDCYCLYPDKLSIEINSTKLPNEDKRKVIFIIDSTWPCSKKILAMSKNIASLPKISFQHQKSSQYKIKTQPNKFCLSTIESTLCVLEILNKQGIEDLEKESLVKFITPFEKMVEYQVSCSKEKNVRFKPAYKR
jgi:DTW domain-containing protein YfiP